MIGRTISHYRIDHKLGEGGMGVVYRATDLSLNRPVAIKFLSPGVADEERRRRFQQEAQAASSLNHPHILTVFEAGTIDGLQYLVTEFIDGETLRAWAERTRPDPRRLVEMVTGVADGLAAAHQAAILHRDIKPENILVAGVASGHGYAKLVDFGLAKLLEPVSQDQAAARTLSVGPTQPGVILGTVAYMSPEAAQGKPADARSDIFSFGVVLYELVAGRRPFTGASDVDLLHATLHADPPPLAPEIPHELRAIVEKALEKDPADRYQSMREMVIDLRRAHRMKSTETVARPAALVRRRRRWWIPAAAVALAAAVVLATWLLRRPQPWENPLANARVERLTDFEGVETDAAISPDGKFVVFVSDRDGPADVWVSQVGSGAFVKLTKGRFTRLLDDQIRSVGFNADGSGVWARLTQIDSGGRTVPSGAWLIPTLGGAPRRLLETGVNPAWSPDGSRLLYHEPLEGDPIFIADRNGSNPRRIYVDEPGIHCHFLTWSPDGRYVFFVRGIPNHKTDIWRIPAAGGNPERITRHDSRVAYVAPLDNRTLLYTATADDGSGPWLYATDVEERVPRRVSFGVEHYLSIASSADGRRLVATVGNPSGGLWTVPVSDRVAQESDAKPYPLPATRAAVPRFGPNFVLYLSSRGGAYGLWRFKDGEATELWKASEGGLTSGPDISPDGRLLCFTVRSQGRGLLYVTTADGTNVRRLSESLDPRGAPSWSPDGKWIAVAADEGKTGRLYKVPLDGAAPVALADGLISNPVWSPDGRLIVYSERPRGPTSVVKAVTPDRAPFPLPAEVTVGPRSEGYRFAPDGKSIVFLRGEFQDQQFWLLDLATGRLRQLTSLKTTSWIRGFDVSRDGKQILFDRIRENSDIVLIERPRQ